MSFNNYKLVKAYTRQRKSVHSNATVGQTLNGTEKTLEFMGEKYDNLKKFSRTMKENLSVLMERLDSVDEQVRELSVALDEFTQYSYGFNMNSAS